MLNHDKMPSPASVGYDSIQSNQQDRPLGATRISADEWQFVVWAPRAQKVAVHLLSERSRLVPLERGCLGYHFGVITGLPPGARYLYRLDDRRELPDPASRFQPEGVHGPSQLVDYSTFHWEDTAWSAPQLEDSILYEAHVGTCTAGGTLESLVSQLDALKELGITTIELMPVAQFPGARNWGYDGVVSLCRAEYLWRTGRASAICECGASARTRASRWTSSITILGPEGNYLHELLDRISRIAITTPWGRRNQLRRRGQRRGAALLHRERALYWLEVYHIDALRLDAIHGIFDFSATTFLAELTSGRRRLAADSGRPFHFIAESDLNDARSCMPAERGGYAWTPSGATTFIIHSTSLLTGETSGYYGDFGIVKDLRPPFGTAGAMRANTRITEAGATAIRRAVCLHRSSSFAIRITIRWETAPTAKGSSVGRFRKLKLAAGVTLLSPFVPMLFMGEEYGETAPFPYFTSHGDPELAEAVRKGRQEEFAKFEWKGDVPDPQSEATFEKSRLKSAFKENPTNLTLRRFYQALIRLRREYGLGRGPECKFHIRSPLLWLYAVASCEERSGHVLSFWSGPVRDAVSFARGEMEQAIGLLRNTLARSREPHP